MREGGRGSAPESVDHIRHKPGPRDRPAPRSLQPATCASSSRAWRSLICLPIRLASHLPSSQPPSSHPTSSRPPSLVCTGPARPRPVWEVLPMLMVVLEATRFLTCWFLKNQKSVVGREDFPALMSLVTPRFSPYRRCTAVFIWPTRRIGQQIGIPSSVTPRAQPSQRQGCLQGRQDTCP